MALLKAVKTIPELFFFLTDEYSKTVSKEFLFRKVNGKYVGITYPQFKKETEHFANGLASIGIKKGDKIAIISENRPEWIYSDMAILSLGGIDVPLYPSLTADSIQFILNNSECKGIILSNKFQLNKILKIREHLYFLDFIIVMNDKDILPEVPELYCFSEIQEKGIEFGKLHPSNIYTQGEKVKENDLCTIIYTSGTTGEPKGVMLTHKNILSNVIATLENYPISYTDTLLSFLPLCHIFERMGGYYTGFCAGGTVYFAESIETLSKNMLEVRPTMITTVPRLFERIYSRIIKTVDMQSPKKQKIFYWAIEVGKQYAAAKKKKTVDPLLKIKNIIADRLVFAKLKAKLGGRLRFFISGGAPLSKEKGEFFEAIGVLIVEGYGLTEASPIIVANRVEDYKFGTVGKPFPGVEIKLAYDGEILAKGPNITQGYYKNKKETEETIKDGWLHTGDIGKFDEEGFLTITDRKKHLFKTSAGKYIAPTPIENMFLSSKYIEEFVLIGDKRMFLSALIVPDFEAVKEYADANGIAYKDKSELVKKKEIYDLIHMDISKFQKKLASYERVRKFTLLERPFTIEAGEITPSFKVKRKIVEELYSHVIEQMYLGLET